MILLLSEFISRGDAADGRLFSDTAGGLLWGLLAASGVSRRDCHTTAAFNVTPKPYDDIKNLCGAKADGAPGLKAIASGKYLLPQYVGEIAKLEATIKSLNPNLIVALGGGALWSTVTGTHTLEKARGTIYASRFLRADGTPYKVLPTYSPQAVIKQWNLRPIVLKDLEKARSEMMSSEIVRPRREIWIEPSLEDIYNFGIVYMDDPYQRCGVDIETAFGTITEIGFAPTPDRAIVVPFYSRERGNYWKTHAEEVKAWNWVADALAMLRRPVFQNGLYDIHYLWRTMGITVSHAGEDTMLAHHAMQPEMKKGLGFLGSIYTREPSWKLMRQDNETLKRED
jgi:uracil-DNA glycosylase